MMELVDNIEYLDLGNEKLSWSRALSLLNQDVKNISNMPALRPVGGKAYFFQGVSMAAKNEFTCDQYRFIYIGRNHNDKVGVLLRYYKIKDPSGSGRDTLNTFIRHVFNLIQSPNDPTPPVCLVHYLGDSSVYIDTKHGNSKRRKTADLLTMKSFMGTITTDIVSRRPNHIYEDRRAAMNREYVERMLVGRSRNQKQCTDVGFDEVHKGRISNNEYSSSLELCYQTAANAATPPDDCDSISTSSSSLMRTPPMDGKTKTSKWQQVQSEMLKFLKLSTAKLDCAPDKFDHFGSFIAAQLRGKESTVAEAYMKAISEIMFSAVVEISTQDAEP